MALELYHPGLQGVIAGETNISSTDGELLYRGYAIQDLVDGASFLEVAHLLLHEELPTQEELADFRSIVVEESELPESVARLLADLPLHVPLADVVRTGVSLLGNVDPQVEDSVTASGAAQATRLMAKFPLLIEAWMRVRDGHPSQKCGYSRSFAGNLLCVLQGQEPEEFEEQSLEVALMLCAEQGFDTPTFAARVAASAQADVYAAVTAALAATSSSAAAREFHEIVEALMMVQTPGQAADWVGQRLRRGDSLPGFETATSAGVDPRASLLERTCSEVAESCGQMQREEVADAIEQAVWNATQRTPTPIWPLTRLLDHLGLEADLHLPVLQCGRMVGWCAHVLEQVESEEVFRPRARYRGVEQRSFEPLALRG